MEVGKILAAWACGCTAASDSGFDYAELPLVPLTISTSAGKLIPPPME
jgi:hypothetical protein